MKTIGLLIPDIANPFMAELARAVEDSGRKKGLQRHHMQYGQRFAERRRIYRHAEAKACRRHYCGDGPQKQSGDTGTD